MFLSPPDITTLLPCSELDFSQGQDSRTRATLADTPPANEHQGSSQDRGRRLFASLIQIFDIWGTIKRKLPHYAQPSRQGDLGHESLPILRKHRENAHELAYLRVTMMLRLCNIAVRQPRVEEIIHIDPAKAQQERYIRTSLSFTTMFAYSSCRLTACSQMLTKILSIFDERMDIWPRAACWKDELSSIQPYLTGSEEEEAQAQAIIL
ncbi:hypothetical protein V2G26_018254 [Clonostachys chloroleuca]